MTVPIPPPTTRRPPPPDPPSSSTFSLSLLPCQSIYFVSLRGSHSRLRLSAARAITADLDGRRPPLQIFASDAASLFFLHKRQVRVVASVFHLLDWNEMKGRRVNNVTLSGGRLRVGKDMAKARITSLGTHLSPLHLVCVVRDLDEEIF